MSNGDDTFTLPPLPEGAPDEGEYIGVPSGYVLTSRQRVGGSSRWGASRWGAPATQYRTVTKTPLYKRGDELVLQARPDEEIAQMQNLLTGVGLLNPKSYRLGVWDQPSITAYRNLLGFANVRGITDREAAEILAANPTINQMEADVLAGGVFQGGTFVGGTYNLRIPDPARLEKLADDITREVTGRKATTEERVRVKTRLTDELVGQQHRGFAMTEAQRRKAFEVEEGQRRTEFEAGRAQRMTTAQTQRGGAAARIVSPVPGVGAPADTMGAARDGGKRKHKGTDVFGKEGAPAVAPISGTVTKAGPGGKKAGNRVWIRGDDGRFHFLAHLQSVSVKSGQRVEQGAPIGTVGRTGNATGTQPHVHYSINSSDSGEDAIGNPAQELRGADGGVVEVPPTYLPGAQVPSVTVPIQEIDEEARTEEMIRAGAPAETQAHDLAIQFNRFLGMLKAPV